MRLKEKRWKAISSGVIPQLLLLSLLLMMLRVYTFYIHFSFHLTASVVFVSRIVFVLCLAYDFVHNSHMYLIVLLSLFSLYPCFRSFVCYCIFYSIAVVPYINVNVCVCVRFFLSSCIVFSFCVRMFYLQALELLSTRTQPISWTHVLWVCWFWNSWLFFFSAVCLSLVLVSVLCIPCTSSMFY